MRNKYGRAYQPGVGPWPGIEASDGSWEVVSPIEEPDKLPPLGLLVECIWVVANVEYRTQRLSYGRAMMVGDREWKNERGELLVFNPSFWRQIEVPHTTRADKPLKEEGR